MRAGGRNPTSDFVQDYAAKRQAQLERAKQLREERLMQQQPSSQQLQPAVAQPVPQDTRGNVYNAAASRESGARHVSHPTATHSSGGGGAHMNASSELLYVSEADFKQATQAGVITPDQARQLWAMLSNQIIRIGPNTETPTTSVNSLLALSHRGSASPASSMASSGRGGFGGSVSLDALRHSIARFKQDQHRQQPVSSSLSPLSAKAHGSAPSRRQEATSRLDVDYGRGEEEEEEEFTARAPSVRGPGGPQGRAVGALRGKKKPEWNMDLDVSHPDDALAYDPLPPMPEHEEEEEDSHSRFAPATRQPAARVARKVVPTTSPGAAKPRAKVPASTAAPSAAPRAAPVDSMAFGGGGGGAALALDDMPVGRGQSSAMTDWDNAYPPGMAPPSRDGGSRSGGGGGARVGPSDDDINAQIAAESAAAASEPLRECGYCGRSFRESLIARHQAVCKKSSKPRKAFDMKAQRADGVEGLVQAQREGKTQQRIAGRAGGASGGGASGGKVPKWKLQHEQFQAAMKAVQQVNQSGGFGSGGPLPPPPSMPAELDDRVPCPHCGRKFAEEVAARHIPKCATTVAKPKGIRPIRR